MAAGTIQIHLDEQLEKEASELFEDFGFDLETAVRIFLKQAVREQRMPIEIYRSTPNSETRAALEEIKDMEEHPENYKSYHSFREVLDEVFHDA